MRVAENYYGVPGNFIGRWRNFGKSLRMAVLLTNQYLQKCLLRRFVPYLACLSGGLRLPLQLASVLTLSSWRLGQRSVIMDVTT